MLPAHCAPHPLYLTCSQFYSTAISDINLSQSRHTSSIQVRYLAFHNHGLRYSSDWWPSNTFRYASIHNEYILAQKPNATILQLMMVWGHDTFSEFFTFNCVPLHLCSGRQHALYWLLTASLPPMSVNVIWADWAISQQLNIQSGLTLLYCHYLASNVVELSKHQLVSSALMHQRKWRLHTCKYGQQGTGTDSVPVQYIMS